MSCKKQIGLTLIVPQKVSIQEKVISKMESLYNLRYIGVSERQDLIDLSGVKVEVLQASQLKFFDYTDGGIVDIFFYIYQNKEGKFVCYIKNMLYR